MSIQAMANAPQERAENRGATVRRVLGELEPFRGQLGLAVGLLVLSAASQAAGPWLVSRAIDEDILGGDPAGLARTMLFLLVAYVAGSLATRGQIAQVGMVGQRLLASLRMRLFEQFQHLPLGYFDRRPIGDLMSRSINDVDTLNQLFSQGLTQLLGSLFGLIGILLAMLALDWRLALACFAIIPIMVVLTSIFAARARAAFRKTRETTGDVTAGLQEEIVGVREAQAFNRTDANIERFRRQNRANRDANVQAVGITSAFAPTMDLLSTLATALVIGYGGYLVYDGTLTVGLLAAFLIYVQQFFRPIQLLSQVYTQVQAALAGAERIYAILDEPREPADGVTRAEGQSTRGSGHAGRIEFDRVTFGYDPSRPVLHDVSFVAEPGQTIALVGPTGAGKTTIANLIPRFYDVTGGRVLIDGRDVREVTRAALRSGIAMVLQEPFLFGGTIRDNVRYGRLDASDEAAEAATRAVEAHEFIVALPDGYQTVLGEGGAPLSQGQRQLVSFARAVLADPRILILDEATSNVDTRTEALIQRALTRLLAGRTSVVIAHRLSTIRRADQILVIEGGRIRERGTHADLLARGGLYAELYTRQSGGVLAEPRPAQVAVERDGR
jgi:ATP-binding cassette subfamily B protein/subfamily B ATP-binding cassette protein MsbA